MARKTTVIAMGRTPAYEKASRRFWLRAILGILGTVAAGVLVVWGYAFTKGDGMVIGVLVVIAISVLIVIGIVTWLVLRAGIGEGEEQVLAVELLDSAIVFRLRNEIEQRVEYDDIAGVIAVYDQRANYDDLVLSLFTLYGERRFDKLASDGEKVEALAEIIRAAVRKERGECHGSHASDRELRRKQRKNLATPFGKVGLTFACAVALGFLFVCVMMEREVWLESDILSRGVVATGLVTEVFNEKGKILVRYEFHDSQEMRRSGKGRLDREAGEELLLHGPINILYLADSPDSNLPKGHVVEAGLPARILCWTIAAFMLLFVLLVSTGSDIAVIRGRVALLRRHELEEEWWERKGMGKA